MLIEWPQAQRERDLHWALYNLFYSKLYKTPILPTTYLHCCTLVDNVLIHGIEYVSLTGPPAFNLFCSIRAHLLRDGKEMRARNLQMYHHLRFVYMVLVCFFISKDIRWLLMEWIFSTYSTRNVAEAQASVKKMCKRFYKCGASLP